MVFFNTKVLKKGHLVTTDEESGIMDDREGGLFSRADIRTVNSKDSGMGFEASFMIVESADKQQQERRTDGGNDEYDDSDEVSEASTWRGTWLCRPYKRERLLEEIYAANRKGIAGHSAVLNTLKNTGIMIFIIDSKISSTTAGVMDSIRNVIHHISKEDFTSSKRCLLYRDHEGRFFNLTLASHTTAAVGKWKDLLQSFSGLQAMALLTILCRSFACVSQTDTIVDEFRPAYLALLLGLVFSEEVSLSWTNVAMFVRGFPSISAFAVTSRVESDWLRKLLILILAVASVTTGTTQVVLTLVGVGLTCAVLLANLGSRAWGFLKWKPIGYWGPVEPFVAFLIAVMTGLCVPYLGHRQVESGGKAAMESVIRMAFTVAVLFVLSDYDEIQKFLVIGSENCNQDYVNIGVGVWWAVSLIASLIILLRKEQEGIWPEDEEPLLEEDHASPVGYKVPNLPEFPIDPSMAVRGIHGVNLLCEFIVGVLMAVVLGAGMCFLAFTNADDHLTASSVSN